MTDSLQKYLAELLGTFTLVFVGTLGILAYAGEVGAKNVTVGFAFGLALLAGLYAFADVSGGHFNPGVSLAMFLDKRLEAQEMVAYWVAQLAGAMLGSLCVLIAFNQNAVASTATLPAPGRGNRALPRADRDRDLCARHPSLVGVERHAGTALVAIPLTLVGRAPGSDPVQRLVAQHGAQLRPGADRRRMERLLGLHRRPARRCDHRLARVLGCNQGPEGGREATATGSGGQHSRRRARGSLRSVPPGGARRGSRPRRAPPGWGTAGPPPPPGLARWRRRLADRRGRLRRRDELRRPADVRGDDGAASRHAFENGLTEGLDETGLAHDSRCGDVFGHPVVWHRADEPDSRPPLELRPQGPSPTSVRVARRPPARRRRPPAARRSSAR